MLAFRSFALGLLGACCLLLAMRPPIAVMTSAPGQIVVVSSPRPGVNPGLSISGPSVLQCTAPAPDPAVTVIDVASGVPLAMITSLIVLAPNEHIAQIDDAPVVDARAALAAMQPASRNYIDITVVSDANESRRVLVLLR